MQERTQSNRGELIAGELGRIWGATHEGDGFGLRISESQALWLQTQMRAVLPPPFFPAVKALLVSLQARLCSQGAERPGSTALHGPLLRDWCSGFHSLWSVWNQSQCSSREATPQEVPRPALFMLIASSSFPPAFTRSMMGLGNWLLMYAFSTAFYQTSLTGSQSNGDAAAATMHCASVCCTQWAGGFSDCPTPFSGKLLPTAPLHKKTKALRSATPC